jgi:hypothetical protein
MGFVTKTKFSSLGFYNAWPSPFQRATVPFATVQFPAPFPDDDVQVFVTPTSESLDLNVEHHAAAIGVAHNVKKDGSERWARSTDCAAGSCSFNWFAVHRKPLAHARPPSQTVEIRLARVQPLHNFSAAFPVVLAPDCQPGDTAVWPTIPFGRPMEDANHKPLSPLVFITQATTEYDPVFSLSIWTGIPPICACVGMLRGTNGKQFDLAARNFDVTLGSPKYKYVALAGSDTPPTAASQIDDLKVTSGDMLFDLQPGGQQGDWGLIPIYFDSPFLTPPIVMMTAQSRSTQLDTDLRAFHGIANHVDQYGFTMAVRSADPESGSMMMTWLAFGR